MLREPLAALACWWRTVLANLLRALAFFLSQFLPVPRTWAPLPLLPFRFLNSWQSSPLQKKPLWPSSPDAVSRPAAGDAGSTERQGGEGSRGV